MLTWLSKYVFFHLWEFKDGAQRARYLRELSVSQWFKPEVLRQRQWKCIQHAVNYGFEHCSYYRRRYSEAGFNGVLRTRDEFRRLPILTKQDIRTHGNELISRDFREEELVEARTGGSTGVSLKLHFDTACQEMRNAAAMRSDRWAGWDIGMQVAAIWGNPPVADTFKKKVRSLLLDRMIYLDTMKIDEENVMHFVRAWRKAKPQIIFGHSHSIYILAVHLARLGLTDLRPRGIISTSMMLLDSERRVIEEMFHSPVTNRYGCEEVGLIACECERREGLHLNMDHVAVEFLRTDGTEASPGEEADIVVTDLINKGMPLIRYRIEDVGVPSARLCSCGRGLTLMERVTGRKADFLKRKDGSLVAGVSLVERTLTAIPGIEQMQLIQNMSESICVKVVKDDQFDWVSEEKLRKEMKEVFGGGISIDLQFVSELDRTQAGKYRFAICNI
jgi:phenylacetate-CoA ligase